jgi:hypothetical protein
MRRGRHEGDTGGSGREALALLASLNRGFACALRFASRVSVESVQFLDSGNEGTVRRLSGRVPAPMIDLAAKT